MSQKDDAGKSEPLAVKNMDSDLIPQKEILEKLRGLVILPLDRKEDGRGVYGQSSVTLAKELREFGVEAGYFDPVENRTFEVKKSLRIEVVQLMIFLAQEATKEVVWDQLKSLIKRKHPESQAFKFAYVEISDGVVKAFQAEGARDDVFEAIEKLI
jgi:hypothetical protein